MVKIRVDMNENYVNNNVKMCVDTIDILEVFTKVSDAGEGVPRWRLAEVEAFSLVVIVVVVVVILIIIIIIIIYIYNIYL
jgi:hypothetical protein